METFLQLVARHLYAHKGTDLSRTAIVFPNKRASLFFNEYLVAESDKPLWSPAYLSISELFRQLSPLQTGDSIRLVFELYKTFIQVTGSHESLDDFYFWGELLISDFDDVDKNLVKADHLFSNLQELKALSDDPSFLSSEQGEALRQFFLNFSLEKRTELKKRFLSIWDKLGDIYHTYRATLQAQGIAYEGMMQRAAVESLDLSALPYEQYLFVGFNVLNRVEIELFQALKKVGRACFYWDYDSSYVYPDDQDLGAFPHEAGEFIRQNLKLFPNELPASCFHTLHSSAKRISLVSSPTENAQARFLPQWIQHIQEGDQPVGKECAVVLCNESLLLPVLHSIPADVKNINVTMGFPLAQTPVYSLVNVLTELQTTGYSTQTGRYKAEAVLPVLRHPYIRRLSPAAIRLEKQLTTDNRFYPLPSELMADEFLQGIFTPQTGTIALCRYLADQLSSVATLYRKSDQEDEDPEDNDDIFNQLYRESLFRAYTLVNRLLNLVRTEGLPPLRVDTLKRLLSRLLTAATIPFHGEPAIGMQVMVYDPFIKAEKVEAEGYQYCTNIDPIVEQADAISLHVPLTNETRNLIAAPQLARMKKNAILINCARGGIINEADLYEALKNHQIMAACLDVFDHEPLPPTDPLLTLDNVIVYPHMAGQTREAASNVATGAAKGVVAVINGQQWPYVCNPEVYQHPRWKK